MANETCGTCRFWLFDSTDPQDRQMNAMDSRPCSLANSAIERGTFRHSTIKACNNHKVLASIVKKESTQKKILGLYAALGKV